jgi:hypothetical protein
MIRLLRFRKGGGDILFLVFMNGAEGDRRKLLRCNIHFAQTSVKAIEFAECAPSQPLREGRLFTSWKIRNTENSVYFETTLNGNDSRLRRDCASLIDGNRAREKVNAPQTGSP